MNSDTLEVVANPPVRVGYVDESGRAIPGRFVGYQRAGEKDKAVFEVPGGMAYALAGKVRVPNTSFYRRQIAQGALSPAPRASSGKDK